MRLLFLFPFLFVFSFKNIAQDSSLVENKFFDINGSEVTQIQKVVNYKGVVYAKIYEKKLDGNYFNGLFLLDSLVVINLWHMNCSPCLAEMPGLNKLKNYYKNKPVSFIAITFNDPKEINEKFLKTNKFNWLNLFVDQNNVDKIYDFYLANGFPTIIILDKNSKVFYRESGGYSSEKASEDVFNKVSLELEKLLKK
jgi:thiol-disulfide isomerase/thioredoxin